MPKINNYVKTFINPAGFIEQNYVGSQTPQEILAAIKLIAHYSKKLQKQEKPVLILVNINQVTSIDLSHRTFNARLAGVKAMHTVGFQRAAVCGPLSVQVLVSTLAMVAGTRSKIRVFDNRVDAVRWLRAK